MRALALVLEKPLELREMLELPGRDTLHMEVRPLVEHEPPRTVDPVRGEEAPRVQAVDRPVQPERVACHQAADLVAERVRVAKAAHDRAGDDRADLRVIRGARPVGLGLAEVVEQRAEAHAQLCRQIGGLLDDGEEVLLERPRLPGRAEFVTDDRPVLRQDLDEDARVARDAERLGRSGAQQELRQLSHSVGGQAAADPLARHVPQAAPPRLASARACRP